MDKAHLCLKLPVRCAPLTGLRTGTKKQYRTSLCSLLRRGIQFLEGPHLARRPSYLRLSNIPLLELHCWLYSSLLNCSSVDGHFGYFHPLALVNKAAMDRGAHMRVPAFNSLRDVLNRVVNFKLGGWGTVISSCAEALPPHSPTSSVRGFWFLPALAHTCCFLLF